MASIPLLANFKCKNLSGVSTGFEALTGLKRRQFPMSRMMLFTLYSPDDIYIFPFSIVTTGI